MSVEHGEGPDDSFDVAIVGVSCRLPGAPDVESFWRVLRDGVECTRRFDDAELVARGVDPALLRTEGFVKAGSVLDEIDLFDASFFGYAPREAELTDPQHRLFLECAWEALERAGVVPEAGRSVGVFAGTGLSTYLLFNLQSRPELFTSEDAFQIMVGNDKDFLATRVSYLLDLRGPSLTAQTGCSTSLVAVHLACQSLLGFQCDVALAGGVAVQVPQRTGYRFEPGGIASPDGRCRPFDADAAGTLFGSGAGVVVLKRLADARADGDHIHAVIKATAVNNDGASKLGYAAPSVEGQVEVIARAHALASVAPDTIGFVEAHGTGTALGDPVEVAALTRAFRAGTDAERFCALGSVKSNLGHLDAAAGVTGLIKAALALEHATLPPTLHFRAPNPAIAWQSSPFFVNAQALPWQRGPSARRAGVSSFGIGGTNAHAVLEEAPAPPESGPSRPYQLLVLSAKTERALGLATARLCDRLRSGPPAPLADVAHTLRVGRRAFAWRRAVVCGPDARDATAALERLEPERAITCLAEAVGRPVAFLFPGGGAQYPAMARSLYAHEPAFREHFDACAELLTPRLGASLHEVVGIVGGEAPAALTRTSLALPALFAVEYALARLLMGWGVEPEATAGHSLGEYAAACLAGVFSLEDALTLVVERGRLFETLPRGAMLSVELPEADVRPLCNEHVALAAVNGPSQCVLAGSDEALALLAASLAERGVEARRVHIDVAAHSHLVEPIMPAFAACLAQLRLRPPQRPFVSGVTGTWVTGAEAVDPNYWVRHLRQTVRFGDCVRTLLDDPRRVLLEVGPGRTLGSLAKLQQDPERQGRIFSSMRSPVERRDDLELLLSTLGRLWACGVDVDFARFVAHERRRRVPLPTYPFERKRYWVDPRPASDASVPAIAKAAEAAGPAPAEKRGDVGAWFYLPSWRRTLPPAPAPAPAPDAAHLLVFCGTGAGAALADRLEARGRRVTRAMPGPALRRLDEGRYELDPASAEDHGRLLAALDAAGGAPAHVVHTWGLLGSDDEARKLGFDALLALGRAFAARAGSPPRLTVVTSGVESVTGGEALRPERALTIGPCRVLPLELPHLRCSLVDLESDTPDAHTLDRLALELEAPYDGASAFVALRGPHRLVQAFEPVRLGPVEGPLPLREGGAYLITGGLGGIGLTLADHLARHARAKLVLVGRSGLPQGEAATASAAERAHRVRVLEALGAEVITVAADVADAAQMRHVVSSAVERFGPLRGVIHAAGVPAGGLSALRTRAAIDEVLRPKVEGTLVLESLLDLDALDFVVLCSSRTASTGDLGQIDHVAANAFLEAFAERCAQRGQRNVMALAWDTWQEVGQAVTTASPGGLEALRERALAHGIRPAEGVDVFDRALARPAPRLVVSTRDLGAAAAESRALAEALLAGEAAPEGGAGAATPKAGAELELAITEAWQRVLRLERVGAHDNFFDLGGNSVIGLRLVAELKRTLGTHLTPVDLFENPTIAGLARRLGAGGDDDKAAYEERAQRGARRRERYQRKTGGAGGVA